MPKLLFISNLFPDAREPLRGLDNATLLHHLRDWCEIRVIAVRSSLSAAAILGRPFPQTPRPEDRDFEPFILHSPYIPKIGSRFNHRLLARSLGRTLSEIRDEFAYEHVLCSWLYPDGCAVARLAGEMSFPYTLIAQGTDAHQYLQIPTRKRLILSAIDGSERVITRSRMLSKLLEEAGVQSEKCLPVYNGVNTEIFHPGGGEITRNELGLPLKEKILLFVGNFLPIKDPLLLIRTHGIISRSHKDTIVRLVLVGQGPLEKKMKEQVASEGTLDRVVIPGAKKSEEVARYMQAADLLCIPSRNEGLPNVLLQALACGLPVIANDVGGIAEVLNQDFLGRTVPSRKPEVLASEIVSELDRFHDSEAIAKYASGFSWQKTANAYYKVMFE